MKVEKVIVRVGERIYPRMTRSRGSKKFDEVDPIVVFSMMSPKGDKRVFYTSVNLVTESHAKALAESKREMPKGMNRIPWGNVLSHFGSGLKIFITNIDFPKNRRAIRLKPYQAVEITEVREKSAFGKIVDFISNEDNTPKEETNDGQA